MLWDNFCRDKIALDFLTAEFFGVASNLCFWRASEWIKENLSLYLTLSLSQRDILAAGFCTIRIVSGSW